MTDPIAAHRAGNAISMAEKMALLHTLAFTAVRLSSAQLDEFITRLLNVLGRLVPPETHGAETSQSDLSDSAELYRHTVERLSQHRATFRRLASESLQQALLSAVQAAGEQGALRLEKGAMDLSATSFDAMELKVLIENLGQTIDATAPDILAILGLRINSWLHVEQAAIATANPFRSEVFLRGIADAWQKFDSMHASQSLVLRQMQPEVFLQLAPIWRALNQELAARHVLPDAEEIHRRKPVTPLAAEQPMQHRLQQWLAPTGRLHIIESRATQLLDRVLDDVVRREVMPPDVIGLINQLRPPLRKVAFTDIDFFLDEVHPARRFANMFVDAGLGCSDAPDGPLFQALRSVSERMQQCDQQGVLFDDAMREIQHVLVQQERATRMTLDASIAQAIAEGRAAHARKMAENDVAMRIESGELPVFVEKFLLEQWTRVLAFAYESRDEKPELPTHIIKAMDDLLWTLQPKEKPEERKELVSRLPDLLSLLNAWLNVVKWEGDERQAFFDELAQLHAAMMRMPIETTARDLLQMRMDMMQKASEYQLNRRAQRQQEEALADFMQLIGQLKTGCWISFIRNDGGTVNCKLVWISPDASRYVFTGRDGKLVFTLTDTTFAQALRVGRASIIVTGPLFECAMTVALHQFNDI